MDEVTKKNFRGIVYIVVIKVSVIKLKLEKSTNYWNGIKGLSSHPINWQIGDKLKCLKNYIKFKTVQIIVDLD